MKSQQTWIAAAIVLATVFLLTVPLADLGQANHPPGSCLDVEPETAERQVGETHILTATLLAPVEAGAPTPPPCNQDNPALEPATATAPVQIAFDITGPNDRGTDRDLTCTIAAGSNSCTASYRGERPGTDTIRGFVDEQGVSRDATEGQNEADPSDPTNPPAPGATREPDTTDVVTVTWTPGPAAFLDCDDQSGDDRETNPSRAGSASTEVYTCRVTDQFQNPTNDGGAASGTQTINVRGENELGVNDPDEPDSASYNTPDYSCTVGQPSGTATGECTIPVPQSENELGTAEICFFIDDADPATNEGASLCAAEVTDEAEASDAADQVEKTWAERSAAGGAVDAEPETDRNEIGQVHAIEATVFDQFGDRFNGNTTVNFEFFGGSPTDTDGNTPATPDLTCTTSAGATCSIDYRQTTTAGRDLLCVWTNEAPSMAGDNTNGTCDGESFIDPDDTTGEPDPAGGLGDDVDIVEKNWIRSRETLATRLDCEPEVSTTPTGSTLEIVCTAFTAAGVRVNEANIDAEITGTNDTDAGTSFQTPDLTCTTDASGSCTLRHGPFGNGRTDNTGNATYRAFIDRDGRNETITEVDTAEARGAVDADATDVVETAFVPPPATLSITPEADSATVGQCNPYTITAQQQNGQPAVGATIDVEQIHELAMNATAGDEPTVRFCNPRSGPNPSDVDTSRGDLGGGAPFVQPTPGASPTPTPGGSPTASPTASPGASPSVSPSVSASPTASPTVSPSVSPTATPTTAPRVQPTESPTVDASPTASPSISPTTSPSASPTASPGGGASPSPSGSPTGEPDPDNNRGTAGGETVKRTDGDGQVTIGIAIEQGQGSNASGRVTLTAFFDPNDNDDPDVGEPQDTATKQWEVAPPGGRTIDCEPETATTSTRGTHTVTCTVRNAAGDPDPGRSVTFTEQGPGEFTSSTQVTTDAQGRARATVTGTGDEEGVQTITGTITNSLQNEPDVDDCDQQGGVCSDSVTNTFEAPAPATCPGFENDDRNQIVGTTGNDVLEGTDGPDIICGLEGNDVLVAKDGDDLVIGGAGNDTITAGKGGDEVRGGPGRDSARGGNGHDLLRGGSGPDILRGGKGSDRLRGGKNRDTCRGGTGDNSLKSCEK